MNRTGIGICSRSETAVQQTFQQIWSKADPTLAAKLDSMCKDIAAVMFSILPEGQRNSILEAGSGTGRISALLAKAGDDVTLLDTSREALAISRKVFHLSGQSFKAIQGSMFRIPVADETYDFVWNAGVLEHFYFDEQVEALREVTRVLKPDGLLVTLNPSARGWIYRLGKFMAEKRGSWAYGQEFPVKTLRPHCEVLGLVLRHEEDVLPEYQFSFIPLVGRYIFAACRIVPGMRWPVLKTVGGYLKLSIIIKRAEMTTSPGKIVYSEARNGVNTDL